MAEFRPQTGQIILAAAQSILQQSQANRELQLRREQLDLQREETANLLELKNQQLEAKQGFLEVQQKQLEAKAAAQAAGEEKAQAELAKTKAETRLKEIQAFQALVGNATGNQPRLPFAANKMAGELARQFDLDKAFEAAAPEGQANPLLEFRGQNQAALISQREKLQSAKTRLLTEFVAPEQAAANKLQADRLDAQIQSLTRGIEIAARQSTAPPSTEGRDFAQRTLSLSPQAYDMLNANAVSVDTARAELFGEVPGPVLEAAVGQLEEDNFEPILRLAGEGLYTGDAGAPVNLDGFRSLIRYLLGRGIPREKLNALYQEVSRGR